MKGTAKLSVIWLRLFLILVVGFKEITGYDYAADATTYDVGSESGSNKTSNRNAGNKNLAGENGVKYGDSDDDGENGYALYRTNKLTDRTLKSVNAAEGKIEGLDFWEVPVIGRELNIAVPKAKIDEFKKYSEEHKIRVRQTVPDLTAFIKKSSAMKAVKNRMKQSSNYKMNWEDYHGYDVIVKFLEAEAKLHDYIKSYSIGQTHEGRAIQAISFTKAGTGKPNVFIEGGIHAREWIAPAVTTFLIRQLAESEDAKPYLDKANFYIVPVANPDGYEYSRTSTSTRLWRKNRRKVQGSSCLGVDLNRNFAFKFGTVGASKDPCKETYMGEKAFSENESDSLRKLFESLQPVPVFALSVHSALNAMLYGRSYDKSAYTKNKDETIQTCQKGIDALNNVNNQKFTCMHGPDLYPTGGDASDWYHEKGSRFAYTIELRDNGWSFLLPPKQILPSGKEFWELIKAIMDKVMEDGGKSLHEVLTSISAKESLKQRAAKARDDYDDAKGNFEEDLDSDRVEYDYQPSDYEETAEFPAADAVVSADYLGDLESAFVGDDMAGDGDGDGDKAGAMDYAEFNPGNLNEDPENDAEEFKPLNRMRLYETEELNGAQAAALLQLHRHHELKFDFWDMPSVGRRSKIMTDKRDERMLRHFFRGHNIKANRVTKNVEHLVDQLNPPKRPVLPGMIGRNSLVSGDIAEEAVDFDDYNSYAEIVSYMKLLEKRYSDINVRPIGYTIEKKPINVISMTKAGRGKPNVLVEAGIHAREWISPAVALHLIKEFATTSVGQLYQRHFNVHIVPVMNVDGYEFSRKNSSTRLWRKNRRYHPDARCHGVDLNRNFDFRFGGVGTDSDKCAQRYHGGRPFSEPEAAAMRDLYFSLRPKPVVTLQLHSAVGTLMYGLGHERGAYPPNFEETFSVCHVAVAVLNSVHKQNFSCIHSVDLYPVTGMSQDWFLKMGSRFVFTAELRNNGFGFLLPKDQIRPSGEEFWEATKYILNKAIEVGGEPFVPGGPEANAAALGVTRPIVRSKQGPFGTPPRQQAPIAGSQLMGSPFGRPGFPNAIGL